MRRTLIKFSTPLDPFILSILRCPFTSEELLVQKDYLLSKNTQMKFPIKDNIISFTLEDTQPTKQHVAYVFNGK